VGVGLEKIVREAVRALLQTADERVLLVEIENPDSQWRGWILPGGGLDKGESPRAALERELWEELGVRLPGEPKLVAVRRKCFPWQGKIFDQIDNIYQWATKEFVPEPKITDRLELMNLQRFRWWHPLEIAAAKDQTFAPRELGEKLKNLGSGLQSQGPLDWSD
jgi:8-oxo-dGTP diphosphatase